MYLLLLIHTSTYQKKKNFLFAALCVCVCEIISLRWFFKRTQDDLLKNNWLRGVILILIIHESIFVGWGFPFSIVLVPRYKLSLCHSYQTWFTWFSGNWCLCMGVAWPRDHEVGIIWYHSLAPLIRLYLSEIFVSCCFRKNSLVSNFFFSLTLRHIKKKLLFH